MPTSWKTSSAGIAAILAAITDIIHSLSTGMPVNWNADIPAIIAGVGLLVAKDSTVHSTALQVQVSTEKAVMATPPSVPPATPR